MTLDLKKIAAEGRGGDSLLAHLTRGEVSIPPSKITPRVRGLLQEILGDELPRYTAGNKANSINPKTGLPEFDSESGGEGPGAEGGHGGGGDTGGPGTGGADSGSAGAGTGNGNGGSTPDPSNGKSSGSMSGKGDNSPAGVNGETTDANEAMGQDVGAAQGPGKGVTLNGPSVAGILGALLAGLGGPTISGANTLTGLADVNGKTAASKTMEAVGVSGAPMGSVSFGGNPGDVGTGGGPGPSGPGGTGPGSDANGGLVGALANPAVAPAPPILAPPPVAPVAPMAPRVLPKFWWQQSRGIG